MLMDKFSAPICGNVKNQEDGGKNSAKDFIRYAFCFHFFGRIKPTNINKTSYEHESQNVQSRKVQHDQMLCCEML